MKAKIKHKALKLLKCQTNAQMHMIKNAWEMWEAYVQFSLSHIDGCITFCLFTALEASQWQTSAFLLNIATSGRQHHNYSMTCNL
jgi:hypothetical protein